MGRILLLGVTVTIALTLPATLTHSRVLGWLGLAAFAGTVVAYVAWRRERARGRFSPDRRKP